MPSTVDEDAFFRVELPPVAEDLRRRGLRFFPLGPDDAVTWYEGPAREPEFVEFEDDDWSASLEAMWRGQGLAELAALVDRMRQLAEDLGPAGDQPADVSPFVYVMY